MSLFYLLKRYCLPFLLAIVVILLSPLLSFSQTNCNPFGFENNNIGGWTGGGSSESVSVNSTAAYIRTGLYSMQFTTTSTSSNKYSYTNAVYGASGSGNYVHFIYWAKGTDAATTVDASMRYATTAPPSGAGSSANASSTATLTTTSWTRLSFNVGGSSIRYYFPAPRRTSGNATSFYIDDAIIYTSNSNTTDLTDPATPSAITGTPSGSNVNLAWTSALDAETGVQATIILRTSVLTATAPDLNDQAQYSALGGTTGPNTVGDWTVVSEMVGATATTYTDAAVASGTYKYAVVLRDLAYNYSIAAVSASVIAGVSTPAPAFTLTTTGFNGAFGNVVMNLNSTPSQQYTVSGTNLTANITVTAPAGFKVSSDNITFNTTATLTATAGTIVAAPVYVRFYPTTATGVTGSLNITNSTTGAASQTVAVNGNALAIEPTNAGTISFGTVTTSSIIVNLPTIGNGSKRIIVARAGSATSYIPTDAVAPTGVNANFTTATDQGSGNKIIYDGTGSSSGVVTVTGLSTGTTYYFTVFEYNEGSGTSQNYLLTPTATGNTATSGAPAPIISIVTTGFTSNFGNQVMGTTSTTQTYTVSGTNLTGNLVITAPADFKIFTIAAPTPSTTVTLIPVTGTVTSTTISVQYTPAAATGASGSLNITNTSTGATTQNVTLSGNALATEPTTAGTISFGTVTATSIIVNLPTTGNGTKRIIVARPSVAVNYLPLDGIAPTGVNAAYNTATDQGNGNKIIYNGTGSGTGVVTVSGLTQGTQYYFTVYEYNEGNGTSQNYLLTPVATGNITTVALVPTITVTAGTFTGNFGNQVMGTATTSPQQYTVSAINLTGSLNITAPTGFYIYTAATPITSFVTSLTLPATAGTVASTTIYVIFKPAAATGTTGALNIVNSSTGATNQSVSVNGNALAVEPTTAGTITFGTVTATNAIINLPTIGNGTNRMIVIHAGSAVSFQPTDGVAYTGASSVFTTATDQGAGNKIVYDGTGSGTSLVTVSALTAGTTYYFSVYEYKVGTGTSQNYLLTPSASGNISTPAPPSNLYVSQAGFTSNFGNVVAGTSSLPQSLTVTGSNLTGNATVTAAGEFKVSLSNAPSAVFTTSVTIVPVAGNIAATPVYVKYSPAAATGASGTLQVITGTAGAANVSVPVNGNALAVEPTYAGTISFGNVTDSTIQINLPTLGNGSKRIIVSNLGSPAGFVPVDGVAVTGVNSNYALAVNQTGGGEIVYNGIGMGNAVVNVTNLTPGMLYYFIVYEYNEGTGTSQNYLLTPVAQSNMTTSLPWPAAVKNIARQAISVYPNPVNDYLYLDTKESLNLTLLDMTGKAVGSAEHTNVLYTGSLPAGNYILTISNSTGNKIGIQKIVKQ